MEELLRTTDPVRLSFLLAQLRDSGVRAEVFDNNISALEAGISAFPQRIMVHSDDFNAARRLIIEMGEEDGAIWRK